VFQESKLAFCSYRHTAVSMTRDQYKSDLQRAAIVLALGPDTQWQTDSGSAAVDGWVADAELLASVQPNARSRLRTLAGATPSSRQHRLQYP